MKIHNGKPIIKVDWEYKSNGDFETFPETFFYSVEEDEVSEVGLVALVKSDNQVFGISSEGDTYQDIYEKSEWTSNSVYDYLLECDPELDTVFKYHFGDACVCNSNEVVVAHCNGIKACDGTWIGYENVRRYMIDDLVAQWRVLQPGVEWDIFKLYDYLEDICSNESNNFECFEYFELDGSKSPKYSIRNSNGVTIAEQGNEDPNNDFVGLFQGNDILLSTSPWKDLTEDKIKSHLGIWKNFGKDMSQEELAIARDDDPVPEVEDEEKAVRFPNVNVLFEYLDKKCPNTFILSVKEGYTVVFNIPGTVIADDTCVHFPSGDISYSDLTQRDVDDQIESLTGVEAVNKAPTQKWFVCYEVTRYYDCCPPTQTKYDGEFAFNPKAESLVDLKKRLADYQNEQDKGMMQKNPLTEKCITIINLVELH